MIKILHQQQHHNQIGICTTPCQRLLQSKMISDYLSPNAEKVKDQFELMMTVWKRAIPRWELSGQGDGGHLGDNDDYNPLKNRDVTNNILLNCGLSSSSESSNENEKEKETDIHEKKKVLWCLGRLLTSYTV
jgi:hypothetical protein